MKLYNLQKVSDIDVRKWIEDNIPELTSYQKERIRNDEIVRFAPFYFYKKRKKIDNIFLRLTIIFIIPVLLILIIGLPFNFIITGIWGYNYKKIKWYSNWIYNCGL